MHLGLPCTFVRLSGCSLRCHYCDTAYAWNGGEWISIDSLLRAVEQGATRRVQITGGEPLEQPDVLALMTALIRREYTVILETNGTRDISAVDRKVHVVMDVKTPGSGMARHHRWENLNFLKKEDEIKFVVTNAEDLTWSLDCIRERELDRRFSTLISVVHGQKQLRELAEQVLESGLDVRFYLPLHPLIWPGERGR